LTAGYPKATPVATMPSNPKGPAVLGSNSQQRIPDPHLKETAR
jgi:hypothetical protein